VLVFIQVIYVRWCTVDRCVPDRGLPGKIRYTSFSLPYHIGNGWFGGTLPLIAGLLVAKTGNIYAGLIWVMAVALMTFFIGTFSSARVTVRRSGKSGRGAAAA